MSAVESMVQRVTLVNQSSIRYSFYRPTGSMSWHTSSLTTSMYTKNTQKRNGENNYDCKIAYTRRFWEYGDSNGGKVVLGSSRQQMGEASHSE